MPLCSTRPSDHCDGSSRVMPASAARTLILFPRAMRASFTSETPAGAELLRNVNTVFAAFDVQFEAGSVKVAV